MTRRISMAALLAVLVLTGGAIAHEGDHQMTMGTIEALDADTITLALAGDELRTFTLSEETSFMRGKKKVARDEVVFGERAAVMFETTDESDLAIKVNLPPAPD